MKKILLLVAFVLALCTVHNVEAQTIRVCSAQSPCVFAWNPNTEADIASYQVFLSQQSGVYSSVPVISVTHPTVTWSLGVIAEGIYFVTVKAVDQSGNVSGPSNELTFSYDGIPSPPVIRFQVSIP